MIFENFAQDMMLLARSVLARPCSCEKSHECAFCLGSGTFSPENYSDEMTAFVLSGCVSAMGARREFDDFVAVHLILDSALKYLDECKSVFIETSKDRELPEFMDKFIGITPTSSESSEDTNRLSKDELRALGIDVDENE